MKLLKKGDKRREALALQYLTALIMENSGKLKVTPESLSRAGTFISNGNFIIYFNNDKTEVSIRFPEDK